MVSVGLHLVAAALSLLWAGLAALAGRGAIPASMAAAALFTGIWAAILSLQPEAPLEGPGGVAEVLRSLAWLAVLLLLYRRFGGEASRRPVRRFAIAGLGLGLGIAAALLFAAPPATVASLASVGLFGRIVLALLIVLAAENVYRNADEADRWHVNLPCVAIGGLAVFDLLVCVDAVLMRAFSPALLDARAVVAAAALSLLAVGAARDRRFRRTLPVSRTVVFHGATLVFGGVFLLAVGLVGEFARQIDAPWGRVAQISLLGLAAIGLAAALASASVRSRIRRRIVDHFFAARYDYRREWQRVLATLSAADSQQPPLPRAVRAVADPVDSPAGLLLMREDGEAAGGWRWQASWNLPEAPLLRLPAEAPLLAGLHEGRWIAELDDAARSALPDSCPRPLWLAVPLRHPREGLIGLVLLAPPRAPFPLDGETFDLLRIIGTEVAVFLAERRAAERLAENRRLADYAKRFAFVAHDVKTVASQLRLLLANAEDHLDDPEFRRDMVATVRRAADRIDSLIVRLRQPAADAARDGRVPEALDPAARLAVLASRHRGRVRLEAAPGLAVTMAAEAFEAAVTHLLDNALEAAPAGTEVVVRLRRDGARALVEITDQGAGMSPEFVRDVLFRPLGTAGKPTGSGIGAWQARELAREAGGELEALTSPGAGTTMRLSLPLAAPHRPAREHAA